LTRKAEIFTFGGAISGTPAEHWKYRVEGAIQTGEKSDITSTYAAGEMQDLEAYGGVANLEYLFNDELQNSVHIGGEYASGDDPSTSDNEQFDLLWAESMWGINSNPTSSGKSRRITMPCGPTRPAMPGETDWTSAQTMISAAT
jgi:hypothetical protein